MAPPYRLLTAIGDRAGIQLYSSPALIEELADVLARPAASRRLALIGKTPRGVLNEFVEAIEVVEPASVPRVVVNDADDDQVIAAAVAASADLIVSGDRRHLLSIGSHHGIAIVAAIDALARVETLPLDDASATHQ